MRDSCLVINTVIVEKSYEFMKISNDSTTSITKKTITNQ